MNCYHCGALLTEQNFCTNCGADVDFYKKIIYASNQYYNDGLDKANVRDLSGAVESLTECLKLNKMNIEARNLLGLVYYEMGEVTLALAEWVISKNLKPRQNLAETYINRLQANSARLSAINDTIRKYNHALQLCREGHEDMASVQLRRILAQNSKLIKGYHLLADGEAVQVGDIRVQALLVPGHTLGHLCYLVDGDLLALIHMKDHEWNKARRILRKAARIDKTNTTTLRFLKEVDERTGVTTKLDDRKKGLFRNSSILDDIESDNDTAGPSAAAKAASRIGPLITLVIGLAAGAAGFGLLVIPSIRQDIYREANDQIVRYSESLASQSAELSKANRPG